MRHYAVAPREWQVRPLVASMRRHCKPFALHVLAWDFDAHGGAELSELGAEVWYHPGDALLRDHPELAALPGNPRSPTDTVCSVRWTFYLEALRAAGAPVTCIDGDLWFWSSPEAVFDEIGDARCAVSPHGFAPASEGLPGVTLESHGKYGRYNGGWVYFADAAPARFMAEAAREWCYSDFRTMADGRRQFGDQGHLEVVEELFGAHVIRHPGVNVGPWNLNRLWWSGDARGGIEVGIGDGPMVPLVSYHYSSLRVGPGGDVLQLADPPYQIESHLAERMIYWPYVAELERQPKSGG